MGLAATLDVLMFAAVCALLLTGYPVAFALGGTALLFAAIGWALGAFDLGFLQALPQRIFGVMTNEVLIAIPLFIYMGVMLERSKVAEDLLSTMGRLMGALPGGLGLAVTLVGALLAASTGVVGATAVTMGLISLPVMLRAGYHPRLACGSIAAAATLAQIIPPSTVLVVLGDQLAIAHQTAELAKGNLAPATVTVADLFAGALLPGLMLAALYMLYQMAVAFFRPDRAPPLRAGAADPPTLGEFLRALVAPLALIVAVLGSILWGLATPTEAASVGAVGATLLAARRIAPARAWLVDLAAAALIAALVLAAAVDLRLGRQSIPGGDQFGIAAVLALVALGLAGTAAAFVAAARARVLRPVLETTLSITTMIFALLIGATIFSLIFRGLGGDATVHRWLSDLPGGPAGAVIVVMLAMFLLGFFLDFLEIVFVIVPVVAPVLLRMEGVDPVWLGVLMAVNLQTSFMHPPLGATLFYLRSVAPPEVKTIDLYLGIIPFVVIQLFALVVLWFFPGLATWLPRMLYGS